MRLFVLAVLCVVLSACTETATSENKTAPEPVSSNTSNANTVQPVVVLQLEPVECAPAWTAVNETCVRQSCYLGAVDNTTAFRYQAQCLRSLETPADLNRELFVWVSDGTIYGADSSYQALKKRLRYGEYAWGGYLIDYWDGEHSTTARSMTGANAVQVRGYYITLTRAASISLKEWTNMTDPVINPLTQRTPEDETESQYCQDSFDCARVSLGCCCGSYAIVNKYFANYSTHEVNCSGTACTGRACVIGPLQCIQNRCDNPFDNPKYRQIDSDSRFSKASK